MIGCDVEGILQQARFADSRIAGEERDSLIARSRARKSVADLRRFGSTAADRRVIATGTRPRERVETESARVSAISKHLQRLSISGGWP
ncbi:hypothetical protein GCM10027058_08310 [Microbacterium neimengense]